MTDRYEQRRRYDQKRRQESPARGWYKSPGWKVRRRDQLANFPTCKFCEQQGITRIATIPDHDPPHRGDWHQFFHGPLISLCKPCHDGRKQADEARGFSIAIGDDGWATDPLHPSNTGAPIPKHRNKR